MSRLRLTINSDLNDVYLVGLTVNRICEHLRMDSVQAYEVELCAVEAVTNAIRHAYANEPGHEVSVAMVISEDRLRLEICDTGSSMPPEHQNRLTQGSDVLAFDPDDRTSLPEGGMGLQIIHDVMDEVSYRTEGDTNSLQLLRLLNAIGGASQDLGQTGFVEGQRGSLSTERSHWDERHESRTLDAAERPVQATSLAWNISR